MGGVGGCCPAADDSWRAVASSPMHACMCHANALMCGAATAEPSPQPAALSGRGPPASWGMLSCCTLSCSRRCLAWPASMAGSDRLTPCAACASKPPPLLMPATSCRWASLTSGQDSWRTGTCDGPTSNSRSSAMSPCNLVKSIGAFPNIKYCRVAPGWCADDGSIPWLHSCRPVCPFSVEFNQFGRASSSTSTAAQPSVLSTKSL
mmetsp:Transcript_7589/g.18834  ORF Transcript_7589/g.18834 Transcript_7589/m.18834 type:complete len:206 (-) Transcript_7589:95-712(-)